MTTIDTLAQAVLDEIKADCFGTGQDANTFDDLSTVTVDGIINLQAVVRAVLTKLKDCPLAIGAIEGEICTFNREWDDSNKHATDAWTAAIDAILKADGPTQKFPTFQEWLDEHPDASPATQAIARAYLEQKIVVMARVIAEQDKP